MSQGGYAGALVGERYRLVEQLGAGGFGRVWKAVDERLRVEVAVKEVLLPQGGPSEASAANAARAEREARHAARLRNHPNVVAVHDVVLDQGVPWIVMELVTGRTLDDEIRAVGAIPAPRLAAIGDAVLGALAAAHAAGIVHRDVKPANVLLADDGRVLLTDFGIAVHASDTALTAAGMVVGSFEYIAPERAEGREAAPAGDLFSCGVTLYHAATGHSPFRRDSVSDSVLAVFAHHPEPLPGPAPLADVVGRLLAKDPAARPTAEAALRALHEASAAAAGAVPPQPAPPVVPAVPAVPAVPPGPGPVPTALDRSPAPPPAFGPPSPSYGPPAYAPPAYPPPAYAPPAYGPPGYAAVTEDAALDPFGVGEELPESGSPVLLRIVGGFAMLGLGLAVTAYVLLSYLVGETPASAASVTGAKVAVEAVSAGAAITGGVLALPGGSPQLRLYLGAGLGVLLTVLVTAVIAANAHITGAF
ncbi:MULTISPECIES: serine/threonine-protein kinase [Kitasatospora]|uniref:non-specific serine/threonine protein kinase n=1 Tax=Kitasatospora setae (strain ATCC 33774 / DSM 43861 / JCM 3304 / KCC A-0304 / NBRC 14216 / KM-6054) TaxID=452652 RepID=E4NID1_KITSK|nr:MULTISPECIES: serine/threonine-protein kinase [Kitasatospora]BAJ31261.1 putative serine/threonine protein kinase [Kitasatospora setae KM-6054]